MKRRSILQRFEQIPRLLDIPRDRSEECDFNRTAQDSLFVVVMGRVKTRIWTWYFISFLGHIADSAALESRVEDGIRGLKRRGTRSCSIFTIPFPSSVSYLYRGVILTSPLRPQNSTNALQIVVVANQTRLRPYSIRLGKLQGAAAELPTGQPGQLSF
jgi:hypothetical protein